MDATAGRFCTIAVTLRSNWGGLLGAATTRFLTTAPTCSEVLAVAEKSSAIAPALKLLKRGFAL